MYPPMYLTARIEMGSIVPQLRTYDPVLDWPSRRRMSQIAALARVGAESYFRGRCSGYNLYGHCMYQY